jgi:hypothetical protein
VIIESLNALDKTRATLKSLLIEKRRQFQVPVGLIEGANIRTSGGTSEKIFIMESKTDEFDAEHSVDMDDEAIGRHRSGKNVEDEACMMSGLPMWPKHAGLISENEETESIEEPAVISGGYKCPNCHEKIESGITNISSLKGQSCKHCKLDFSEFVEKCESLRTASEDARMLVDSGHFGRIHDAIDFTGAYIQQTQEFALFPNAELMSTIVHLAHLFLLESVV